MAKLASSLLDLDQEGRTNLRRRVVVDG
jgi:hypothetical protein